MKHFYSEPGHINKTKLLQWNTDMKERNLDIYEVAESYTMNLIRQEHPEWVEKDGSCKRCEQYYSSLDSLVVLDS